MEIRQLQYFLRLCKELHFSEAAYKLGISQPTLSQQIRVLEDEVGVPLFDRIGKKTVKTEAGELLEHYASQVIQQLENAKNAISDLTHLHTGHLRVAVLPSDLDYRLTPVLISFHKEFPHTKVQVIPSIDIYNEVLDNKVDIGVGLGIHSDHRLHRIPFYTETHSLYVNTEHDLADRDMVVPEDLAKVPLVMFPKGFVGRDLVDRWCEDQGILIHPLMETGSATSLFQLVKEGIGATIQPSQLIESFGSLGVRAIPIEHAPTRHLEMFYRVDKYVSPAAKAFIQKMEMFFKN
ncbi:LysR substrate-binding domain-containing protein [Paenibacillus sp. 23TSA30-6]|uniref:LysR substrate-binding domain-containing protein n=1 Tax=Paenibacillus sp. 23TSA30-6 TaxID=2546104 RepID=UPI001788975E|nr:LysR substrate-binding domain-containing protein [Paenibacillus sp. 23TSA30-6]MBE0336679.1 LysR family transcriptional regulator [Paenibacillus sp. 23TSA30-6]